MTRKASILLAAALLAAAVTGTTRAVARPPEAASVDAPGFHTHYPAEWTALHQSLQATIGTSLVWLSNQAMHDPCSSRADGGTLVETCSRPIDGLQPGGLLVQWQRSEGPTVPDPAMLDMLPGRVLTVDDEPAKLNTGKPDPGMGCDGIRATRVVTATIIVGHIERYDMQACLRGPHLALHEAQVESMVRAAQFTP